MPLHAHLLNWLMLWRADDQTAGSVFVLPKLSKKNVTGSIGLSNTFSRLIEKVGIEIQKCGKKPGGWREVDQSSHIARISHTRATHLASHLVTSRFGLPHQITADMPWSFSPPGDQSITQSETPECEMTGIASTACAPLLTTDLFINAFKTRRDFFTFGRRHAVFFCKDGPLKQR
jgi:hypothetical protein